MLGGKMHILIAIYTYFIYLVNGSVREDITKVGVVPTIIPEGRNDGLI